MNYVAIYEAANAAGYAAVAALEVVPMVVQERYNPLDDGSPVKREYFVPDGPCGFAGIVVRDIKFANVLKRSGIGRANYGGGYRINVSDFNQSLQKKEAYAEAFAKVLNESGIRAYAESRMD